MDLDNDGQRDVITGSWPGRIYWFRGRKNGTFARGRSLRHEDGAEIEPGNASAPFAADWDGDGDLDLLVGNIKGVVKLLPRLEGDGAPVFGKAVAVEVSGKALNVRNDAGPVVADWDGDGRSDLLVGDGFGNVVWFKNTAKKGAPVLAAAQTLIHKPERNRNRNRGQGRNRDKTATPVRGSRTKLCVTDWNEDGHLDLLLGEFGTAVAGKRPKVSAERRKELRESQKRLGQQIAAAQKATPGENADAREARLARRDALCARWVQIDQELSLLAANWLGRVWLFQRKAEVERQPSPDRR